MISTFDVSLQDEGAARFLDCRAAAQFTSGDELVGIGLSITFFHGQLNIPHVEAYVQAGAGGLKTFLTAEQARALGTELLGLADMLAAGVTSVAPQ